MLTFSSAIADPNASLQPFTPEALLERLRGDQSLCDEVLRLRKVRNMDADAYRRLKARLPYFCCATFRDGVRRTAHFEAIASFVLDIDHFSSKPEELAQLRQRLLGADDRIALAFVSPGGDGLKLWFRLDAPCADTKRFSDFYKAFAQDFGERHGLTAYLDFRTADATRACFLSHDPEARMAPNAVPVRWEAYLPEVAQPALAALLAEAPPTAPQPSAAPPPNRSHEIRPDVYAEILRKLKTQARPDPLKRPVFVPAALDLVLEPIRQALSGQGIEVAATTPIQHGRQLSLTTGANRAELNLFYGQRGFSVVLVPKRGTHPALGELAKFVAEQAIFSTQAWEAGRSDTDAAPSSETPSAA